MTKTKVKYDNESIQSLKGADRVRLRPSVIFGSDDIVGCQHSVFEILSNSIDEAREGHGNQITVTRFKDNSIEVEDFGRGMPVDYNQKEGKYNWELLFCDLYAGGKYNNIEAENYEFSLGLNGLGLCATQYASEYMDAEIFFGGFKYNLHFEKGEIAGEMKKEPSNRKQTGTRIRWRPDLKVFTEIDIPLEYFDEILKKQAIVNAGVTFIFKNEVEKGFETTKYYYENGIEDYVAEIAGGNAFTPPQLWKAEKSGRDRADKPDYRVKMQVSFCFCNTVQLLEYYHNSSWLEHGGSPEKAVKNAFLYEIDSYIKQVNKYSKGESRITFQDIQDCLILVTNSFSTQTSYENQTKKSINNKFIQEAMTEFLRKNLEVYFIENKSEADKIADQILVNKRSRENAEKARINLKKKLSGGTDVTNRVQKFVDCRSREVEKRELYIVEGDSALGSCKLGRDAEFQAIIPVRGKILNCLKSDYDKIFKNEIITDLLKVLGCGVEVKNSKQKELESFDFSLLRYNKVIICTDADYDGFHIRTMILTMLYCLTPTLINKGRVYIAESPLFEITTKNKTYFAYNEKEKNDILQHIGDTKATIQRSKGLGENEPEMMWQTTMNPQTRRLIKVTPDDIDKTKEMFDLLLGDNLAGRKDFIAENGYKYLEVADIS